jgi:phosphatidylglycerol:prolipoprotein diacylglycerol transferase
MFPTLQVGPLSIQVPGLVLLLGLWLGLTVSERRSRQRGENPNYLYTLLLITLLAGFLGARLSYAVTYPDAFSANLLSLISLNPGLLDLSAGIYIAAGAATIFIYRKKLPLWSTLDSITPIFAILAIALGVSHLASGSAFGKPTGLPFGIQLWGAVRHPTQIYEIILGCLVFTVIWLIDKTTWNQISGNLFLTFIALTALSRLFLEAYRGDSFLFANGIRSAQLYAWILLAICLLVIVVRNWKQPSTEEAAS